MAVNFKFERPQVSDAGLTYTDAAAGCIIRQTTVGGSGDSHLSEVAGDSLPDPAIPRTFPPLSFLSQAPCPLQIYISRSVSTAAVAR